MCHINIARRCKAHGAVKKKQNRQKSEGACQCLYMFFITQSKKSNLRQGLNYVPINQIVFMIYEKAVISNERFLSYG